MLRNKWKKDNYEQSIIPSVSSLLDFDSFNNFFFDQNLENEDNLSYSNKNIRNTPTNQKPNSCSIYTILNSLTKISDSCQGLLFADLPNILCFSIERFDKSFSKSPLEEKVGNKKNNIKAEDNLLSLSDIIEKLKNDKEKCNNILYSNVRDYKIIKGNKPSLFELDSDTSPDIDYINPAIVTFPEDNLNMSDYYLYSNHYFSLVKPFIDNYEECSSQYRKKIISFLNYSCLYDLSSFICFIRTPGSVSTSEKSAVNFEEEKLGKNELSNEKGRFVTYVRYYPDFSRIEGKELSLNTSSTSPSLLISPTHSHLSSNLTLDHSETQTPLSSFSPSGSHYLPSLWICLDDQNGILYPFNLIDLSTVCMLFYTKKFLPTNLNPNYNSRSIDFSSSKNIPFISSCVPNIQSNEPTDNISGKDKSLKFMNILPLQQMSLPLISLPNELDLSRKNDNNNNIGIKLNGKDFLGGKLEKIADNELQIGTVEEFIEPKIERTEQIINKQKRKRETKEKDENKNSYYEKIIEKDEDTDDFF
jgi:hypothetical protein